jgi:hypothetical protein
MPESAFTMRWNRCSRCAGARNTMLDSETGSLRQPIYVDDGYGTENSDDAPPCTLAGGWGGGICLVPSASTLHTSMFNFCRPQVITDPDTLVSTTISCASEFTDGIDEAMQRWDGITFQLALAGATLWNWQESDGGVLNDAAIAVQAIESDDDPISRAVVEVDPIFPGLFDDIVECATHNKAGKLCRYKGQTINLNIRALERDPIYVASVPAGRRRMVANIVAHELGHVAGLGHVFSGPPELMSPGGDTVEASFRDNDFSPTPAEMRLMCHYNPDKTTPVTPCDF